MKKFGQILKRHKVALVVFTLIAMLTILSCVSVKPPETFTKYGVRIVNKTNAGITHVQIREANTKTWTHFNSDIGNIAEFSKFPIARNGYSDVFYGKSFSRIDIMLVDYMGGCYLKKDITANPVKIQSQTQTYKGKYETVKIDDMTVVTFIDEDMIPSLRIQNLTGYPITILGEQIRNYGIMTYTSEDTSLPQNVTIPYTIGKTRDEIRTTLTQKSQEYKIYGEDGSGNRTAISRPPTVTIKNETGSDVQLGSPFNQSVRNGNSGTFTKDDPRMTRLTTSYSIGTFSYTIDIPFGFQDVTHVIKERPPILTIKNNTGYDITLTSPLRANLSPGNSLEFPKANRNASNVQIVYTCGRFEYKKTATLDNKDNSISLTERPPLITIKNNTRETVNNVHIRKSGTNWGSVNILKLRINSENGIVGGSRSDSEVIDFTNGDEFKIWLGSLDVDPTEIDIRLDDVKNNSYVKQKLRLTSDMTMTFTQSDK